MDLVDIDKVLDNLEMREEAASQNQRAEERLSKEHTNCAIAYSPSKLNNNNNLNNIPTTTSVTTMLKRHENYHQKVDETDSGFQPLRTTTIVANCKKELAQYEREAKQSEDIRQYSEPTTKIQQGQMLYMDKSQSSESSESITTSSPSTFSSGPSLEGVTSMEDSAIEQREPAVISEMSKIPTLPVVSQTETIDKLADNLSLVYLNSTVNSILPSTSSSAQKCAKNVVEDCTDDVSKSTLSLLLENQKNIKPENTNTNIITTLTSSTTNVSIVVPTKTSNVKNNLNISEAMSINHNATPPKIYATAIAPTVDKQEVHSQPKVQTQIPVQAQIPESQISGMQPITFCSTMDDISDTELDSMLQEMDIDDDMDRQERTHQQQSEHEISQLEKSLELSQQESVQYCNRKCYGNTFKSCDESNIQVGTEPPISALTETADYLNGDSFSQASTVEFSEIRAPLTQSLTTDNDGGDHPHSPTPITTAHNSLRSLGNNNNDDGDVDVDDSLSSVDSDCLSLDDAMIHHQQQQQKEKRHKDISDLCHTIPERECNESLRPQRPTTLNLPSLHTLDLYANAGQTPPGNETETNDEPPSPQTPTPDEHYSMNAKVDLDNPNQGVSTAQLISVRNDIAEATGYSEDPHMNLGKIPPIWVPDNMANGCMQCSTKFTMIKRRHHCRACGKVLCSVCCSQKYKLEFLSEPESRICIKCYLILTQRCVNGSTSTNTEPVTISEIENFNDVEPSNTDKRLSLNVEANRDESVTDEYGAASLTFNNGVRSPNPNNPMEYCSTIPPHKQVSNEPKTPPTVIVPVGVLKKDNAGSYSSNSSNSSGQKARKRKSVMFSDGIAPGSDLASADQWNEPKQPRRQTERNQRNMNIDNNINNKNNKPLTPGKALNHERHAGDTTTMGLMAQLFRGSIPPVIAANTIHTIQQSALNLSNHLTRATLGKSVEAMETTTSTTKTKNNNNDNNNLFTESIKTNEVLRAKRLPPSGCDENGSFIPHDEAESLPPLIIEKDNGGYDYEYKDVFNNYDLVQRLQSETLKFAVQKNFHVLVKIVNLKCCLNRIVINFTTQGMHHVGNDEIVILLEVKLPTNKEDMANKPLIPKDIFLHLNEIYNNADHGNSITELCHTTPQQSTFLGSRYYGGFIYIRPTYQCMQDIIVPDNPYLIGILIHRSEVPWAKVFPLRLMLRLGAQYRYYPCPHVSIRQRESVYAEIAQTIINFLADFRNYSYTLPFIRGMYIHMEDRQTTVVIPRNRLEEVIKAVNNSSDHILAFGGNFSKSADGHLVCMQNVGEQQTGDMYAYSTQAINIQGQPRKVTGASFFVLNESLKTSSGLSGKCSIVEDGLMVQILPSKMEEIRNALKNQNDCVIVCGPVDADEQQTEIVCIKWVDNDKDINIGVKSPIDEHLMNGVPSMRVHTSFKYSNSNYSIKLTDIYVLKCNDWYNANSATLSTAATTDITRITEQIARSTSIALVPFLDLLVANKNLKIGLRFTLHQDNVCYEAGSNGSKLPPIYMNALDNHLIPTLHGISSNIDDEIILEVIFYILNA